MPSKNTITTYFGLIVILVVAFFMMQEEDHVKTYHHDNTYVFHVKEDMQQAKIGIEEILDDLGYEYRSTKDSIVCEWKHEVVHDEGFDRETNKLVFTFNVSNVTGYLDRIQEFTHHPAIERNEDVLGKVVLLYKERYPLEGK